MTDADREAIRNAAKTIATGDGATPEEQAGASLVGWKPIASEACAVHPRRRKEAIESAIKKGVPTEFNFKGQPIFTSRSHRKQYLKAYGMHDNDGSYGD